MGKVGAISAVTMLSNFAANHTVRGQFRANMHLMLITAMRIATAN
jgi:hypothetical protein